jgi:anti-sigma-K factor RskA
MIDPPEDVRQRHANAANVLVACQIAAQLRHRVNGFTPVVLNFDAEDGAVSRVVLLRFVDGEMDVKANSGGLA